MDPLGFRWQASVNVLLLIEDLAAELGGLPDDQVLTELNETVELQMPGLFSYGIRTSASLQLEEWPEKFDQIFFDAISRDDHGRQLVAARIVSIPLEYSKFCDRLVAGVAETRRCRRSSAILKNRTLGLTTTLRVTHVQHPFSPNFPETVVGLDSAWRIALGPAWRGQQSAMRSVFVRRDCRDKAWLNRPLNDDTPRQEYWRDQDPKLPDYMQPACNSDDQSISLSGIPNDWLFDHAAAAADEKKRAVMPISGLIWRTQIYLGLYTRNDPWDGRELERLQPILDNFQQGKHRPVLRDELGRKVIVYRRQKIGRFDTATQRIFFSPMGSSATEGWGLWSCPLERDDDLEPMISSMMVDAAWAWEILLDGRHFSSFLGPLTDAFPDIDQRSGRDMLLDDDRHEMRGTDGERNTFANWKYSALHGRHALKEMRASRARRRGI